MPSWGWEDRQKFTPRVTESQEQRASALRASLSSDGALGLMLPFSLCVALLGIDSGGLSEHAGKMRRHVCRQNHLAVGASDFTCQPANLLLSPCARQESSADEEEYVGEEPDSKEEEEVGLPVGQEATAQEDTEEQRRMPPSGGGGRTWCAP